jgi:Golgi phosphoprotein 3 (GPP34)
MQTIADDLLLVLLDEETGRPRVDGTRLDFALAGAVLLELAMNGSIDVLPGRPRKAPVVVVSSRPTEDEILDGALRQVGDRRKAAPQLVPVLSKGLRRQLIARGERSGRLRGERTRILGLFPVDRFPAADSRRRSEVLQRLQEVLVGGATPDARTSALIAVLAAVGAAPMVVGPLPRAERKAVKRRASEIGEGAWAADAVQKAVAAVQAAVAASAAGAVVAATTASS